MTPDALHAAVMTRIGDLLRYRAWYRGRDRARWLDLAAANDAELRSLLRLVRQARRSARETATAGRTTSSGALGSEQQAYPDWAAWQAAGPWT